MVSENCDLCGKGLACSIDGCGKRICSASPGAMACKVSVHYIYKNKRYCLSCVHQGLVPLDSSGILSDGY